MKIKQTPKQVKPSESSEFVRKGRQTLQAKEQTSQAEIVALSGKAERTAYQGLCLVMRVSQEVPQEVTFTLRSENEQGLSR